MDHMIIIIVGSVVVALVLLALCLLVIVICLHRKRRKRRSITLSNWGNRFEDVSVISNSNGMHQVEPYSSVACYGNEGPYLTVEINYLNNFQEKSDTTKDGNSINIQKKNNMPDENEMVSNVIYESYEGERNNVISTLRNEDASYVQRTRDSTYQTIAPARVTDGIYDSVQYKSDEGFEDNIIYEPCVKMNVK